MIKHRSANPGNALYFVDMNVMVHRAVTANLLIALEKLCASPQNHAHEIDSICKLLNKHMSGREATYVVHYSDEEYETLPNDLLSNPLKYFLKKYSTKDLERPPQNADNT